MSKKFIWWILTAVVIIGGVFWFNQSKTKAGVELIVEVTQGEFEVLVTVTGELQAKNFENIFGPDLSGGVYRWAEFKIQDMVPEGTIVEKGEYIAEIDRTLAKNAIIDIEERIERQEVQVSTVRLDTSFNLRALRDDILNRELSLEEIKIKLEQSMYEAPATIRQVEFELERAQRALEQQRRLYILRDQHYKNWMFDTERTLTQMKRQYQKMLEIYDQFTVRAPKNGMVIYRRERFGQKRRIGSSINPSDNVVATLPDLSVMMSRTYVNEIDISKVKAGQKVRIGVDAFPDKKYTGFITSVANIGEQLANADAKVFEVMIEINESDPIMKPSMTTSNQIVINTLSDVTYVSIDAIFSQDSIPFVYTTNLTKQVVVLGDANESEIIVEQGLSAGDKVYVSIPENSETWKMTGEELIPIIKERALERKKVEKELERKADEDRRAARQQRGQRQGGGQGGGQRQGGQGQGDGNRRPQ